MLAVALLLTSAVLLWPPWGAPPQQVGSSAAAGDRCGEREESEERPRLTDVADATDLISLALTAGGSIPDALDSVARVAPSAVARDLRRVGAALRWGRDMREAWSFASPGWAPAATALVVSTSCGAPASEVLRSAAARIRESEERRLEAAAGRAAVLLVLPLGLFFLPAFVATSIVPMLLVLLGESLR